MRSETATAPVPAPIPHQPSLLCALQRLGKTVGFKEIFRPPSEAPPGPGTAPFAAAERHSAGGKNPDTDWYPDPKQEPQSTPDEKDGASSDLDFEPSAEPGAAPPDRLERILAQQALRPMGSSPPVVEQVAEQLLRRCLVQGDGRSGRVRLELGGAHHGSVVELLFDGASGQLHVEVDVPDGAAASTESFLRGLGARLRDKGLCLDRFEVRGLSDSRIPGAPEIRQHR